MRCNVMEQSFTSWENELYHHGIKGQKWGVRKYQNADGSLTAAGEARYGNGPSKGSERRAARFEKKAAKLRAEAKEADTWRKTALGGEAAKIATERRQKAKKLEQKAADERSGKASEHRKKVAKTLAIAGGVALAAAGAYIASKNIKNKANQKLNAIDQMKVSRILASDKETTANVIAGTGRNYNLANHLLANTRKDTNRKLAEARKSYLDQAKKNKSVIGAYKYLKGRY